jgi:hypothetical protein
MFRGRCSSSAPERQLSLRMIVGEVGRHSPRPVGHPLERLCLSWATARDDGSLLGCLICCVANRICDVTGARDFWSDDEGIGTFRAVGS